MGTGNKGPRDWIPREPQRIEELRRRIDKALRSADQAFWKEIAKEFPEVKSGEFYPEAADEWNRAIAQAVHAWLRWNHPRPHWIETIVGK